MDLDSDGWWEITLIFKKIKRGKTAVIGLCHNTGIAILRLHQLGQWLCGTHFSLGDRQVNTLQVLDSLMKGIRDVLGEHRPVDCSQNRVTIKIVGKGSASC